MNPKKDISLNWRSTSKKRVMTKIRLYRIIFLELVLGAMQWQFSQAAPTIGESSLPKASEHAVEQRKRFGQLRMEIYALGNCGE